MLGFAPLGALPLATSPIFLAPGVIFEPWAVGAYAITGRVALGVITLPIAAGSYAYTGATGILEQACQPVAGSYTITGGIFMGRGLGTFYITECARTIVTTDNRYLNVPSMPPLVEQNIPITRNSVVSQPFSMGTRFVIINCDHACSIEFGLNPVAIPTIQRMAPNETRKYGVMPGQSIAVTVNQ